MANLIPNHAAGKAFWAGYNHFFASEAGLPMSIYYINGDYVNADEARLPAGDLAILRGFGVFDYLRTYGGRPFQLAAHLRRLQRSAALLDLNCPWDIETLGDIVCQTLRRNSYAEAGIRIVITGGDSQNNFMPAGDSRLLVMITPHLPMPLSLYRDGAEAATVEMTRYLPEAKSINYIPGIMAQKHASKLNPKAIDAIYRLEGKVLEGTRSNIFIFKAGKWITPGADVLLGITRAEVMKLIEARGTLEMRDVTLAECLAADEIIITSSTKEIMPLVKLDDRRIGAGSPGPATRQLMRAWREMTDRFANAPQPHL